MEWLDLIMCLPIYNWLGAKSFENLRNLICWICRFFFCENNKRQIGRHLLVGHFQNENLCHAHSRAAATKLRRLSLFTWFEKIFRERRTRSGTTLCVVLKLTFRGEEEGSFVRSLHSLSTTRYPWWWMFQTFSVKNYSVKIYRRCVMDSSSAMGGNVPLCGWVGVSLVYGGWMVHDLACRRSLTQFAFLLSPAVTLAVNNGHVHRIICVCVYL